MSGTNDPVADPPVGRSEAELLMERESRVCFDSVGHSLDHSSLARHSWQLKDDEFLLRGTGDSYFYYRKGAGVTIDRGADADLGEEQLWLNGSVYAAIASINGLMPIHASAVAYNGQVYAFTGPSGVGKSTLVAALGKHGLPMFCDDTLILDIADPGNVVALPGHKRLKLTSEALSVTGASAEERVSSTIEKFYARPSAGEVRKSLPLSKLVFLEEGPEPSISDLLGAERFNRLQDDHYTFHLFEHASTLDPRARFERFGRLAAGISMARFERPRDVKRFDEGVAMAEQFVRQQGVA